MFFKKLLTKWRESIEIFRLKNISLFFLASLNTFRRSLVILTKNSWWMIPFLLITFLLGMGCLVFCRLLPVTGFWQQIYKALVFLFSFLAVIFLSFFIFLTVRPSIENKDIFYFVSYLKKFWLFLILVLFQAGIAFYFFKISNLFPIFWVTVLFFLDSRGKITSLFYSYLNGLKAVIFYFPVFFVLGLIKLGFISSDPFLQGLLFPMNKIWGMFLSFAIIVLFDILFLSFLTVYYVKIKHKDFHFFHHK